MIFIKDEAIVLRSSPSGTNDLSITVFTKGFGKENIYIKGGQILKNMYLPKLQPFNWIKGVFVKYKEKTFIKEIDENVNLSYPFTKDLDKLDTALWILHIFDKFTIFNDEKLYSLLKNTLYYLQFTENRYLQTYKLTFLVKYIALYGILPSFNKCVKCGVKINKKNFQEFSFQKTGSLCKKCSKNKKTDLSYEELVLTAKLLKLKFKDINKQGLIISPILIKKLQDYLENH